MRFRRPWPRANQKRARLAALSANRRPPVESRRRLLPKPALSPRPATLRSVAVESSPCLGVRNGSVGCQLGLWRRPALVLLLLGLIQTSSYRLAFPCGFAIFGAGVPNCTVILAPRLTLTPATGV